MNEANVALKEAPNSDKYIIYIVIVKVCVGEESTAFSTIMSSSVVVRNNAPNWPAMVSKSKVSNQNMTKSDSNYNLTSATASLWMQSRVTNMKKSAQEDNKKMVKFASKTTLARQCTHCQILYTNFHSCTSLAQMHGDS